MSCRSPNSTSPTGTTCCGQVASILVASSSDMPDTTDFIVTCQRHPREDVTSIGNFFSKISTIIGLNIAQIFRSCCSWSLMYMYECNQIPRNWLWTSSTCYLSGVSPTCCAIWQQVGDVCNTLTTSYGDLTDKLVSWNLAYNGT